MRVAGLLACVPVAGGDASLKIRQLIRKIGFPKPDSGLFPGLLPGIYSLDRSNGPAQPDCSGPQSLPAPTSKLGSIHSRTNVCYLG